MSMGSSISIGTPSPPNLPNSTPPPSFFEATQHPSADRSGYRSASSTLERNRNIPLGSHARKMANFERQHSKSMDDITDPWKLRTPYVYNNNSYEAGDVPPLHTVGFIYQYADKAGTVPKRYKDTEPDNRYVRESQAPGAGLEFTQGATGEDYAVPYTQIRPGFESSRLRKSVSNPELLESALRGQDLRIAKHDMSYRKEDEPNLNRPPRPNLPLNWKFLKNSPVAQRKRKPSETNPTSHQANNSNNNTVKVASPSVQTIQSSGKTKVFKRQASQDSQLGMTKYTQGATETNAVRTSNATSDDGGSVSPKGATVSETPC